MRGKAEGFKSGFWIGLSVLVVFVGGFVAFVLWPKPPANVSSIESWLNSNGFEMFRPFRDNVPPGSVLRIESFGQSIAATAEMVGLSAPQVANVPNISWKNESDLDSLATANLLPSAVITDAKEAGATGARVSIDGVTIHEIPLLKLSDAAKNNATLLRLTKDRDSRLVLVSSVLEAGSIRCEFFTRDSAKLDIRGSVPAAALKIGEDFRLTNEGALVSTVPLLLGYHASGLGTQALSLGEQPTLAITLKPLSIEDVAHRRESSVQPHSDYQIFALILGLGNYAASLPGARDSAMHVADRLRPFVESGGGKLDIFVSSPDATPPVTKDAILKSIAGGNQPKE
jgi:hypothetical protein